MTYPKNQTNPPTQLDLLKAMSREIFLNLNCVQIGIIKEFDASKQMASIQLALKAVVGEDEKGKQILQSRPALIMCPVVVLFGGVDFLSMPVAVGDTCLVLFNDREIDNWYINGGTPAPTTGRAHDLSDGIALVGIRSLQNSIASYLANGIRLSHGIGGNISKMDWTDALIHATAAMFTITGNLRVEGNIEVTGNMHGNGGGAMTIDSDLTQSPGKVLKAGNGANGTFTTVNVQDGIVVSGT